jgi:O-antigen ligase
MILTTAALFLSSGALVPLILGANDIPQARAGTVPEGRFLMQILWTSLYGLFIALAVLRRKRLVATLFKDGGICLLVGLAILSTVWSDAASLTLWESARLLATTFFGIYLAKHYRLDEIFHMVAWSTALSMALSVVFALALPEYGTSQYMGQVTWCGVFDQKNELGRAMTLGAFTWALYMVGEGRVRWLGALMLGSSSLVLLLSASKSSLAIEFILLFVILAFTKVHRSVRLLVALCLTGLLTVFIAAIPHPVGYMLELLDRSPDLTGRTEIWAMILDAISKHPLIGYGYHAFWRGADGPSADINFMHWIPPHSHNGFLDLALDFGVGGPVLFILVLIGPTVDALRLAQRRTKAVELFPFIFLLYMLLTNLTESDILEPMGLSSELLVALCIKRSMGRSQLKKGIPQDPYRCGGREPGTGGLLTALRPLTLRRCKPSLCGTTAFCNPV